jgi:acetyl esterase/lipase
MRSRYDHRGRRASSVLTDRIVYSGVPPGTARRVVAWPGGEVTRSDDRMEHPPVRTYRPSLAGGLPVCAFFHGGGWALGNLDTHDRVARDLAAFSGAVVVAVDYRLAPEDPFPAAYDDCLGVTRRLLEDGAGLDADRTRVAVAGDSAGGNLAAVACQQLRGVGSGIVHHRVGPVSKRDFETGPRAGQIVLSLSAQYGSRSRRL